MNKTTKFYFDLNDFDAPDVDEEIIEEEIEEVEPPPPTFSEEELDVAKAVAHSAGKTEGINEERGRREQYIADTLKTIADNFSSLFAAETYREKQYEEEALRLALEIIDMIAPSLNNRLGQEALRSALKKILKDQSEQSEIIIEVHPDSASDISDMIDNIWKDKDSAPRYKVLADSSLEKGACSLTWQDGGMVRDPKKISDDIKQAIEALLVEQVMSSGKSPLTGNEKNAIKNQQDKESAPEDPPAENNGEPHE